MLFPMIVVALCAPLYAFSTLSVAMRAGGRTGASAFSFPLLVSFLSLTPLAISTSTNTIKSRDQIEKEIQIVKGIKMQNFIKECGLNWLLKTLPF